MPRRKKKNVRRFGELSIGARFMEIDKGDGSGALAFPLTKQDLEERRDPQDGSTYWVNANSGNLWTYFGQNEEVRVV